MHPRPTFAIALAGLLAAWPVSAQQLEHSPRPPTEHPQRYLAGSEITYRGYLAPPPAAGSLEETLDIAAVNALQATTTPERWTIAEADEDFVYPQFEAAFGGPIDREHTPRLIHLLNEALHDAAIPTFAGKSFFARARPYQRWQLTRVCGEAAPPPPEPDPEDRSSYPSGHAVYGWTTALVLAAVAPDRGPQLLARGHDYGLSRVICGVHFPSDVAAGQALASAVVARLQTAPAFQQDLACAKAEHTHGAMPSACAAVPVRQRRSSAAGDAVRSRLRPAKPPTLRLKQF